MKTEQLVQSAKTSLLKVTDRPDIVMSHGKGMYITDTDGKQYLDFIGGWAVNCLGHSPQRLINALYSQAEKLVNASPSFYNTPMLEYAHLLTSQSCFDRVFFTSTGAEANEGAIKLARKFGQLHKDGAYEIITTLDGFHGRTLATMAATGKEQWEQLFAPKTDGFVKGRFNDIESIRSLVTDKTCAIMLEPIQGEGGVHVATEEFMLELRELSDDNQLLLIFDEIQTGMARTGTLFCYEHYGIEPDIMTLGKGIGGGFPLSAMLTKENLNIFSPGDQGGTYTGQPLAMAVGLAVLNEIMDKGLADHCKNMGEYLSEKLHMLSNKVEITNIRGKGLLQAFDINSENGTEFVQRCLDEQLIINSPRPNTIRLMPPLIVCETDIDRCIDIMMKNL